MEMKALEDLFLRELGELYNAEQQIVKALPKMAQASDRAELRRVFETHLKQTERQVGRLETIFKDLGREGGSQDSEPVAEIIRQGNALISEKHAEPAVRDAALIATAQKVEHYEIALYGSARSHAKMLGYVKVAGLLGDTLKEEEQTDSALSDLAIRRVNVDAAKAPFSQARLAPRGGEETSAGTWGFGALLVGVLIGAAVALLYAPKSGDKIRRDLRKSAEDLRSRGEDLRDAAGDLIDRGRRTINQQRDRISRAIG
jgi:ferritin-like metal-binding protein YciE